MKKLTESEALRKVLTFAELKGSQIIPKGLIGLKRWSVIDFLLNHCEGYILNYSSEKTRNVNIH